ncbi:MAG: competence/damage-inducible protein A [Verrucomicrobiota bacterium]|nr:competence/damage-inducible protein A [Verrucomicrobiota bacterium]
MELINTGTELLMGRVLNIHQQWLGQQLALAGYELGFQQTIPDNGEVIQAAVRDSISRCELIIVTGGLGPTSDDITRERIAELLEAPLEEHAETRQRIVSRFKNRNRSIPNAVMGQALVPQGAKVLPNDYGTAPGLMMQTCKGWLILLPGPPRELHPMYINHVAPILAKELPPEKPLSTRTFKTMGIGESSVEELISEPLNELIASGLRIGYCARMGEVDVRLTACGAKALSLIKQGEETVRKRVGKYIYGVDDDLLEGMVVRVLTERKESLVVAESCTGGLLSHRITNVPGSSSVFLAGYCTYSNESKENTLGVLSESIDSDGAVSERVAREMAEGARLRHGADYALATTGIAGPTGGTKEKPVGTVFIALATPQGTEVMKECNRSDRETFKIVTTQQALNLLRQVIEG